MIGDIYSIVKGIENNTELKDIKPTQDPSRISSAQYGYEFNRWDVADSHKITNDISVTGLWTSSIRSYEIKFINPGNLNPKDITADELLSAGFLQYGCSVSPLADPTPINPIVGKNYLFTGWTPELTSFVSSDYEYRATYSSEWQEIQVTFKESSESETALAEVITQYGTRFGELSFPAAPAKEGYEFYRWNQDSEHKITQALTALAQYSPNDCLITFEMMGHGEQVKPIVAKYDSKIRQPTNLSAGGYQFVQWNYTDPTTHETARWIFNSTTVFGDTTLSAQWRAKKYDVVLTPGEGISEIKYKTDIAQEEYQTTTSEITINVSFGTKWAAYAIPAEGHTYRPYTEEYPLIRQMGTETQHYSPESGIEKHNVIFYESTESPKICHIASGVEYGTEVKDIRPEDPTRESSQSHNYAFDCWDKDDDFQITSNTNIYGKWNSSLRSYDIKFTNSDSTELSSGSLLYGTTPTYDSEKPTNPSGALSRFADWNPQIYSVQHDETYRATYQDQVSVTFYQHDHATVISSSINDKGLQFSNALKPIAQRRGWTFDRWSHSNTYVMNTDISTYALYTINSYLLKFDLQGHGNAIDSQLLNFESKALRPKDPDAIGYTFGNWYKEKECQNIWDFNSDRIQDGNRTLYAKWTVNQYKLELKFHRGIKAIYWKRTADTSWSKQTSYYSIMLDYGTSLDVYAEAADNYTYSSETQLAPKTMVMGIYGLVYQPIASGNPFSVACAGTYCTVSAPNTGRYDESLRIQWTPDSDLKYVYTLKKVCVYAGTSSSGTLLKTYKSGTAADFVMDATYYSQIYIVGEYTRVPNNYTISLIGIGYTSGNLFNQCPSVTWTCPASATVDISARLLTNVSSCGTKVARTISYKRAGSSASVLKYMWNAGEYNVSKYCNAGDQIQITGFCGAHHGTSYKIHGPKAGSVCGAGTYQYGSTATIRAIGNGFKNWSDGVTTPTRTIYVDRNISLTAYFS